MINKQKHSGVIVPMVTPLNPELSVDKRAVDLLVENLIRYGAEPFVLGTTGEASSMSDSQKEHLVKSAVKKIGGRCTVYAGIAGNSYINSVEEGRKFADMGVDILVCHLPSYYPMDSSDINRYFETMADELPCPLILYNMPATTGISIPVDVADRLSYHPNIAGIKESERDMARLDQSLERWSKREDFSFLLGWAAQSKYALEKGADGIVPSTGNFTPGLYKNLYDAVRRGEMAVAEKLQARTNYYSALYQEGRKLHRSIPALKVMLSALGLCQSYVLPPLYKMEEADEEQFLKQIQQDIEVLKAR